MRNSLKPVLARVERLADQVRPPLLDVNKMTDTELELEIIRFGERLVGPATKFPTADAFAKAVCDAFLEECAAVGHKRDRDPTLEPIFREHWERVRWFQEHAGHSQAQWFQDPVSHRALVFVKKLGGETVVTCSCGAHRSMYWSLIPADFQALMRRQIEADPAAATST